MAAKQLSSNFYINILISFHLDNQQFSKSTLFSKFSINYKKPVRLYSIKRKNFQVLYL